MRAFIVVYRRRICTATCIYGAVVVPLSVVVVVVLLFSCSLVFTSGRSKLYFEKRPITTDSRFCFI
jgi:hypothetical protein